MVGFGMMADGLNPGSWWLSSKSDSRWDCSGKAEHVGSFSKPDELEVKIQELTEKFGTPPDDCKWGYMKY